MKPEGISVRYLGGFAGFSSGPMSTDSWVLTADNHGLAVFRGSQKHRLTYKYAVVRNESWNDLRMLSLDGGSASRANIPALAVFGVLGLAARRDPGTYIAVSYTDGDVFFHSQQPAARLRVELMRFLSARPDIAARVYVDGSPLEAAPVVEAVQIPRVDAASMQTIKSETAGRNVTAEAVWAVEARMLRQMRIDGQLTTQEFHQNVERAFRTSHGLSPVGYSDPSSWS